MHLVLLGCRFQDVFPIDNSIDKIEDLLQKDKAVRVSYEAGYLRRMCEQSHQCCFVNGHGHCRKEHCQTHRRLLYMLISVSAYTGSFRIGTFENRVDVETGHDMRCVAMQKPSIGTIVLAAIFYSNPDEAHVVHTIKSNLIKTTMAPHQSRLMGL